MKVGEFLDSNRDAGDEQPEEQSTTSLTPSGLEVLYSWHPKRLYRVRKLTEPISRREKGVWDDTWREVPSVTTVLGVLDKSGPLIWWGQGVGGIGALKAMRQGEDFAEVHAYLNADDDDMARKLLCQTLTKYKLSTNHVRDGAAARGVSVHSVLEGWAVDIMFRPDPENYEEHERGYIRGLCAFLDDLGEVEDVQAEVMVGSLEHGFAGRYDIRLTLPENPDPRVVTKIYPKRESKWGVLPGGKYLLDLKTSKSVYETHALQLAAYEMASVECGYGPTDYRAVIHVTEDGRYEFVRTSAQPEDFLAVLRCYQAMQGGKGWLR